MQPRDMTIEQQELVHKKLAELSAQLKEILGADIDLLAVAHKRHGPDEECTGAFVLTLPESALMQTYEMIAQGMMIIQGAVIQQAMENNIPPGTNLQ